jgi:hypothetical protein
MDDGATGSFGGSSGLRYIGELPSSFTPICGAFAFFRFAQLCSNKGSLRWVAAVRLCSNKAPLRRVAAVRAHHQLLAVGEREEHHFTVNARAAQRRDRTDTVSVLCGQETHGGDTQGTHQDYQDTGPSPA